MPAVKRDRLISSCLLELGTDISNKRRNSLNNTLAASILKIIKNKELVQLMLASERKKIYLRGNNSTHYLFGNEETLESVTMYFYENSVLVNDNYKLRSGVTLTELVLMYGVFSNLYTKYYKEGSIVANSYRKERKKLMKNDSNEQVLNRARTRVETNGKLKRHIFYIKNSIWTEIQGVFGIDALNDMFLNEYAEITSNVEETIQAFPVLKGQLTRFAKEKDLDSNKIIELLYVCGDSSSVMNELVENNNSIQKVKN